MQQTIPSRVQLSKVSTSLGSAVGSSKSRFVTCLDFSLIYIVNVIRSFLLYFRPFLDLFVRSEGQWAMDSTAVSSSLPEFRDVFPDYHNHDELYKFSIHEVLFFFNNQLFLTFTQFPKSKNKRKEYIQLALLIHFCWISGNFFLLIFAVFSQCFHHFLHFLIGI